VINILFQYFEMCQFDWNTILCKRLLHDLFHIGPGISPRLPYQAPTVKTTLYRSTFFDIFLKPDTKKKYLQFEQKTTLLRNYFRNLSVQRSCLQYKSQCLEKVNVKYAVNRLWHEIFHIVPSISPRPISVLQIFELTNCENNSLRELSFVQIANIFSSCLVSKRYRRMSICTMSLENVWHEIFYIVPGISRRPISALQLHCRGLIWESRADTRANMEKVM
jgi:hypothetical protein